MRSQLEAAKGFETPFVSEKDRGQTGKQDLRISGAGRRSRKGSAWASARNQMGNPRVIVTRTASHPQTVFRLPLVSNSKIHCLSDLSDITIGIDNVSLL